MNHAILMLLDTHMRSALHNQPNFALSKALHASAKCKYNPQVARTFVSRGKKVTHISAMQSAQTSLF
jgi:hypothetical protein